MQFKRIFSALLLIAAFATTSCSKENHDNGPVSKLAADPVLYWNEVAYDAFGGAQYQHSLMASRINAMLHLAMHDALNGIEKKYSRYAFNGKDKNANPVAAAAAAAAHTVLKAEIPQRLSFLDSALNTALQNVNDAEAKRKGLALGEAAAQAVLARRNDGAAANPISPIPPSTVPGIYQAVPPFDFMFAPHWKTLQTFSLERPDQFRSAPVPAINSVTYTAAFNEVKSVGQKNSAIRTADQTAFAKFWYEFSEAGWNRVARTAIISKKLNMLDAARLLALTDMAIADAYIAGWNSKLYYNFWRPFTAIRNAANDGNDATGADAIWEPSEPTPPIHDYPSTHSALGNAAAAVLARVLGDATPFTMTSPTAFPAGSTRSYNSFSQAAKENAESRVMAGIHFRFSCEAGLTMGEKVGQWTVGNHLQPIK